MEHTQRLRICNRIFLLTHFILSLALGISRLARGQIYFALLAFVSFPLLLAPDLLLLLFKKRPIPELSALVYFYCTLAFTGGMALQAYHLVPYYDKAVHTLSGVFFAFLGLLLYALLSPGRDPGAAELPRLAVFSFSFSMLVAAVWELYEYGISLISTLDPQNVLTTGVHDTMLDLLVCLAGAALFLLPEYLYFRRGRRDLFLAAYEAVLRQIHGTA